MKSIKTKIVLSTSILFLISVIAIIGIGLAKSSNSIEEVVNYQYEDKIQSANNMLLMLLDEQFGSLSVDDQGLLVDSDGNSVAGKNDSLDMISKNMNIIGTIFVKTGNDYTRVLSTLKDSNGERLVGTLLDTTSDAYKAISKGKTYYGLSLVQGKEYLTGYEPMYDSQNNIIGMYATAVPTEDINAIISINERNMAITLVSLSVVIIAIAILLIYLLSAKIAGPIKEASYMIKEMSLGHFNQRLKYVSKDEVGQMSKDMNSFADDLQYVVLDSMKKISEGDINIDIVPKDDQDALTPTLLQMVHTIQTLISETEKLAIEAENGNLSVRGDAGKFKGDYISIVNGINGTLESVVTPIREVTRVMEQLVQGNLKVFVEGEYKGEYVLLKDSVNNMIKALNNIISEIGTNLTKLADADLNINKVRDYKGDFITISNACNTLIDGLNKLVRDIYSASSQVASGSEQIADTSVMLSQGAEEQASSIEEVTSAITEMASQVQENASNATQADTLSKTAKENAVDGNEQMQKMLVSMRDINESSNNISKIIKVIDDIAFQTNILALNAAVEAARAGQYGKGFAVVAEEVRNLAQKSAAAAKETTTMIESSIDKVKLGTDIASSTEQALKEIVGSVTKSSELVSQIAYASNEQASAITQVSQAIEQVSGIVQTNSATAEETASASEELTSQAEMLRGMVKKFRLRDNT